MSFLGENKEQMEAIVRQLGYEPDGNFLLAYNRMSTGAKVAVNIFLQQPWIGTGIAEKQHLIIFTPDKIVVHRLKKNGATTIYPASEITNFTVRDGANKSTVFEFTHGTDKLSFYSYKDFSVRYKYVAENLAQLTANHFVGYAQA